MSSNLAINEAWRQLKISPVNRWMDIWQLEQEIIVRLPNGALMNGENIIVVPKGFRTDFASVPKFLRNFFPPMERYGAAAVVHDYLYVKQWVDRKTADRIFYDLVLQSGVGPTKAKLMYWAVRIGGRRYWQFWQRS